ncbi:hypothetical protein ECEPECC34262_5384 [Escherichia coli EPEC C342-62]|nr:hypothetical protein ECDEC12C_2489 [Escherichia coli DEC12C]EIQ66229.1 hypothetical protein ECEPECC34262_5384 [Escherichia coli EPEC C342-62]
MQLAPWDVSGITLRALIRLVTPEGICNWSGRLWRISQSHRDRHAFLYVIIAQ